jgi:CRP-like cAMP-binding protein
MEHIRSFLETMVTLNENDWQIFSSKLIRHEFPKKTILLKVGKVENYLSFIEKGIIRFYIPKDTNDITFVFAFENSFVSAYDSFLLQIPAHYNVETLTNTVLWRMTHKDLQDIYKETEFGNILGRIASEQLFLINTKREYSFLNESAEQRYLNLFAEQPHLIKFMPLKYLASYIGITPQALSRIRRRIS